MDTSTHVVLRGHIAPHYVSLLDNLRSVPTRSSPAFGMALTPGRPEWLERAAQW